jgi:hypothetical protein
MKSFLYGIGVFWLASGVSGCVGGDDPARAAQALNGVFNFDPANPCTPAQQTKVNDAMVIAHAQVNLSPAGLTACLRDAVTSADQGHHAEVVLQKLAQNLPTTFGCRALTGGRLSSAQLGVGGEQVLFDTGFLATATDARAAAELLRAIAEANGYKTPGGVELPATVPEHVRGCSESLSAGAPSPNGAARGQMLGDTVLQHLGDDQGAPFGSVCAGGSMVVGATFFEDQLPAGDNLVGLSTMCEPLAGGNRRSLVRVGAAGVAQPRECALGEVVVGLEALVGGDVDEVTLVCQSLASVQAGLLTGSYTLAPAGGSFGPYLGPSVVRRCPAGMAVRAVLGRVSATDVDRLQLACEAVQSATYSGTPHPTTSQLGGALNGTDAFEGEDFCGDRGVLRGLYGRLDAIDQRLTRLGGKCGATSRSVGTLGFRAGAPNHGTAAVGRDDPASTTAFDLNCAAGSGLVGVAARVDPATGVLAAVRPRCANLAQWEAGVPTIANGPAAGAVVGVVTNADCPQGEFVMGMRVRTETLAGDRRLDAIIPLCRTIGG